MPSRCIPSNFLTSLQSNTVYLGKSLKSKYHCPDSLCAEIGSISRPAQTISEAIDIIEKNYKDRDVSLSIFSGTYKEEDILEYKIPSNLISIYSESPKTTFLFGHFIFSNTIEIENITFEGTFSSRDMSIKNCNLILVKTIEIENQNSIEFIDSSIKGSISYKNSFLSNTKILYKNCSLESLGNTINSFELENDSSLSCSFNNCSLSTEFSTGILKTVIKDNSKISISISNSNIIDNNKENYSIELIGFGVSTTTFSIISSNSFIKSNYMFHRFSNDSNFNYILENNTFELENQMHKKELINNGIYRCIIKNNTFHYKNPILLNKPLCEISIQGGKNSRFLERNTIEGNTEKDKAIMFKSLKDTSYEENSKENTFMNNGEGNGLRTDGDNSQLNVISSTNIFKILKGKSKEKNFINNSKLTQTMDNVIWESKEGILLHTDESSSIDHILTNIKYSTNDNTESDSHNQLNGNIKSIFTTSTFQVGNSDKNVMEINGGSHNFSNCSLRHNGNGHNFSIKDSNVECSTSNLLSKEGRNYSVFGKSNVNINTTQLKREGIREESMIKQEDESNIEISASNLTNNIGHCIEKTGGKTKITCNAIKTNIKENYNVIQGDGTLIQSDSQCCIGSSKTSSLPINVPSKLNFI